MKAWFWEVMVALDQLCNAALGGSAEETISARCGRRIAAGECVLCWPLCWLLDRIDPGHCATAYKVDGGVIDEDDVQPARRL